MRNKEQNFEEIKAKLSEVDYFILGFSTAFAEKAITLLTEIRDTLQGQNEPKMLFIKDVAKIMKINQYLAGRLWDRDDFPRN